MDPETLYYLQYLYERIDIYFLVLVRVIAFLMYLPVVSGTNIPLEIRLLLAVVLSAVIFSSGAVTTISYNNSVIGYFLLILTEFLAGLMMGFILYFIFNVIFYAGQLIDYQIGFSMMSVLDPLTQLQVPITGNLYFLGVSALLVVNGGIHSFIKGFYDSYRIIPMGLAYVAGNEKLAYFVVALLTEFLVVAVQIALPIIGTILVIDAALGILVKAVPQMNVFVVGMPMKVLGGIFILLMMVVPMVNMMYAELFDRAYNALNEIMWGMKVAS